MDQWSLYQNGLQHWEVRKAQQAKRFFQNKKKMSYQLRKMMERIDQEFTDLRGEILLYDQYETSTRNDLSFIRAQIQKFTDESNRELLYGEHHYNSLDYSAYNNYR